MDRLILNCDLGEDEPLEQTQRLLELVDAANIGCGFHAGHPEKTRTTIRLANKAGVLIGAHPGLQTEGGRGDSTPSVEAFRQLLDEQVGSFYRAAHAEAAPVHYLKLHGTLYHAVEASDVLAGVYLDFLTSMTPAPAVFSLANGRFAQLARAKSLHVYQEAFADRAYLPDGSLQPRAAAGAVLCADEALTRFEYWIEQGSLPCVGGTTLRLEADTLCVHGDSHGAVDMILAIRKRLIT